MEELKLYEGRPADCTGRLEKEIRTYDLLDKLGIQSAIRCWLDEGRHHGGLPCDRCLPECHRVQEPVPVQPAEDG